MTWFDSGLLGLSKIFVDYIPPVGARRSGINFIGPGVTITEDTETDSWRVNLEFMPLGGGGMSGPISMGGNYINNYATDGQSGVVNVGVGTAPVALGTGSSWVTLFSFPRPAIDGITRAVYSVHCRCTGQTPFLGEGNLWIWNNAGATTIGTNITMFGHARVQQVVIGANVAIQVQQHASQAWTATGCGQYRTFI